MCYDDILLSKLLFPLACFQGLYLAVEANLSLHAVFHTVGAWWPISLPSPTSSSGSCDGLVRLSLGQPIEASLYYPSFCCFVWLVGWLIVFFFFSSMLLIFFLQAGRAQPPHTSWERIWGGSKNTRPSPGRCGSQGYFWQVQLFMFPVLCGLLSSVFEDSTRIIPRILKFPKYMTLVHCM